MEFAACQSNGTFQEFAEQQLVDCDKLCYGCNGGTTDRAFYYFESHYEILLQDYAYTGQDGTCLYNSMPKTSVKATGYYNVTADSPSAMQAALANHVLSIAIEANQYAFQTYSGGIFNNQNCGTNLDHATNIVGWGTQNGVDYWIMRNSWGTTWGDQGYMYIQIEDGHGICGCQMEPNYPTAS